MNEMSRFCTNCGAPLRAGTRFCGQCGAPVLAAPAAPAAPAYQAPAGPAVAAPYPPPVAEPILAIVLGLQRHKGFMGMGIDTLNLVVTPARLIFAMVTQKMMNEAITVARNEAKGQGKGWLGQVAAQMGWQNVIGRQYTTMPVDAILTQYPGSFAIPTAQVTQIRFHESSMDDDGGSTPAKIVLQTTGGKYQFDLRGTELRDAREALRQVLPHAVR